MCAVINCLLNVLNMFASVGSMSMRKVGNKADLLVDDTGKLERPTDTSHAIFALLWLNGIQSYMAT